MNAVNRAKNKCMENMLCSASNRKQLVEGTTIKSSDRGDKEMKSVKKTKRVGDRRREKNRFSPESYRTSDSDLSLGLFSHPSLPQPQCNFPPFLITDCLLSDLSPVPFYHLTVGLSVPFRPKC